MVRNIIILVVTAVFAFFWLFNLFASDKYAQNDEFSDIKNQIMQIQDEVLVKDAEKEEVKETPEEKRLNVQAMDAVKGALKYLSQTQNDKGYWLCDVGYKLNDSYQVTRKMGRHPGVTAIACLAFMANGHFPGRGEYGDVVRKGLNFVMSTISSGDLEGKTPGFISWDGTRMYSHAFSTLFLAQILGMANFSAQIEKLIRDKLRLAIQLIIKSQNRLGAWRYEPNAPDADMSIAVCQLQAMRAARNVGFKIPTKVIVRAKEYISNAYDSRSGGFKYQYNEGMTRIEWTLTAAGICAMQQAGQYEYFYKHNKKISLEKSIKFLFKGLEQHNKLRNYWGGYNTISYTYRNFVTPKQPKFDYFYGHYYAAQAIYQYSRNDKKLWKKWINLVRRDFLNMLQSDGTWNDQVGKNYATAMASLILQIHHEYLPIFQK